MDPHSSKSPEVATRTFMSESVAAQDYKAQVTDWHLRTVGTGWEEAFLATQVAVEGRLVLDCGCGPGAFGPYFAERKATVVGLDREMECLRSAAATRAYSGLVQGDARSMPFRDGIFQVVLLRYLVHHVSKAELSGVIREARRILAPGGALVVETAFEDHFKRHFDHQLFPELTEAVTSIYPDRMELSNAMLSAGLSNLDEIPVHLSWEPYAGVGDALKRSEQLVTEGKGSTAWLRLTQSQRQRFHNLREIHLPTYFVDGTVPRYWHGAMVVGRA